MAHHKEVYDGCEIEIEDDAKLTIDGKHIDIEHNAVSNKWSSRYLPYTQYDSLLEMAKAIAHHAAEFPGREKQAEG